MEADWRDAVTVPRTLIVCSFAAASAIGGLAHAGPLIGNESAYVVTRPGPGIVQPAPRIADDTTLPLRHGDSARVVARPVADPGPTADRDLSRQSVRPWLTELQLANTTTVHVDPFRNYRQYTWRGIDQNHSIIKAQRLGLSRLTTPAYVVRNLRAWPVEAPQRPDIEPRAIFRIRKAQPQDQRKVAMAD